MTIMLDTLHKARNFRGRYIGTSSLVRMAKDAVANPSKDVAHRKVQDAALRVLFEAAEIVEIDAKRTVSADLHECARAAYRCAEYRFTNFSTAALLSRNNVNRAVAFLGPNWTTPVALSAIYDLIETRQLIQTLGIYPCYDEMYGAAP